MKNQLGLLMSLAVTVSFAACAPKDDKLPARVNTNLTQNNNDSGSKMKQSEVYSLMAVTFERAFEALALAKATLNPAFAQQLQLTTVEQISLDNTIDSKMLTTVASSTVIAVPGASFVAAANYEVEDLKLNENNEVMKLVLTANSSTDLVSQGFLTIKGKPTDFKSVNMNDRIVLRKAKQEGRYRLELARIDNTSSQKDKSSVIDTKIVVLIAWDGKVESLDNEIAVLALSFKANRSGQKTGAVTLDSKPSNLSVTIGRCVSINGDMVMKRFAMNETKPTVPDDSLQLVIKDSSFEISKDKFSSKAQPCESRPLVDLTRML